MKNIFLLTIAFLSMATFGQDSAKRISNYNLEKKVAIQGYDPVAYFVQKKAIKGKSTLASTYDGVVYYFSSQANKDTFAKNPSSY